MNETVERVGIALQNAWNATPSLPAIIFHLDERGTLARAAIAAMPERGEPVVDTHGGPDKIAHLIGQLLASVGRNPKTAHHFTLSFDGGDIVARVTPAPLPTPPEPTT